MGKVIGVVIGVVLSAGVEAQAAPAAFRMGAVPEGAGWHCFTMQDRFARRDRSAVCVRSADECELRRDALSDSENEYTTKVSGCFEQAKAAVITFFDVMEDAWRFWALPSTQECADTRRYVATNPDRRSISACRLIGAVVPPPGAFRSEVVAPGEGWFCSRRAEDLRACRRAKLDCEDIESVEGEDGGAAEVGEGSKCEAKAQASAFTARGPDGVLTGLAMATPSACAAVRARIIAMTWTEVSPCKSVGAVVAPPIDRAIAGGAQGWHCYAIDSDAGPRGSCSRSADVCAGALSLAGTEAQASRGCTATSTAHAHERGGALYAFPSRALCLASARASAGASRCEVVP